MKTSAERLKKLREEKGLSQADCAKALGLDRTTYVKYENGGSIRRNIEKLARFFNVSTDYLLGRTGGKEPTIPPEKLTAEEKEHLQKYRALTADHREDIDTLVQHYYDKDAETEEKQHA